MLPAPLNLIPISIAGVLTFVYYAERVYRHYVPGKGNLSLLKSSISRSGSENFARKASHRSKPSTASSGSVPSLGSASESAGYRKSWTDGRPLIGLVSKIASILWGQGGEEEGVCKAHKLVPRAASNAIVRCDPVFIF